MNKNTQRATWGTGQVTGGRLYCRKQPSKSAAYWGQFADGATIPIKEYDSTWYETYWGGISSQTGYVMRQYITNENWSGSSGDSYPITVTVDTVKHGTGGTVNLRKTASTGAAVVTTIPNGSTVYVKSLSGTWLATKYGSYTGFVMAKFIVGSNEYGGTSSGGGTSSYKGLVCQGNTDDAGDCRIFYNKLSDKYSSVTRVGFNTNSDVPLNPYADVSDFRSARNYDVLYWSSHGSSTPILNLGDNGFNSTNEASAAWNQTSYKLKVPIIAACNQFDGSTNRSNWAKIMRQSNIRAFCGYHEGAPGHPYDENVATDFFKYVTGGSTGNSVMYSWQHANQDNGNNSTYMVMVYQNDDQCYYRLPGFSSKTYRDPNRGSDSIYAYASFMSGAVSLAEDYADTLKNEKLPCELSVAKTVRSSVPMKDARKVYCSMSDAKTGATFIGYGEYPLKEVDLTLAQQQNAVYAKQAFGTGLIDHALKRNVQTEMFEVLEHGAEGKHTVIATATQFINQYKGVPIAANCIVITSDANGINSISNKWRDVSPMDGTSFMDYQAELTNEQKALVAAALVANGAEAEIQSTSMIYVEKEGKYVLCHDVQLSNGEHMTINCLTNRVVY